MPQNKGNPTIRRARESKSTKTYTFLGVTLAIVLVFLLGAIRPTLSAISEINNEVKEKERVDSQLQQKINSLTELQNSFSDYEENLEILDAYFPTDMDYSIVMAGLERITSSWGFEMSSLSIKPDENEQNSEYSGMEPVILRISINGPKSQIVELLDHLESLPVVPEITSVSYSLDESYRTGFVSLSITMNIYKME